MMDLYAEDLADYIYQESDVDKKRVLLLEVEAEIKKLMMLSCVMPYMTFAHTNLIPFRTYCD